MCAKDVGVVLAILSSAFASASYMGLALYFTLSYAEHSQLMFVALLLFCLECSLWIIYSVYFLCHEKNQSKWQLKLITFPHWDLVFSVLVSSFALITFLYECENCSLGKMRKEYLVSASIVLAIVVIKMACAIILEIYHRHVVRYSLQIDDIEERIAMIPTGLPPSAPPEYEMESFED